MGGPIVIMIFVGGLALAFGTAFASILQRVQDTRDDCPLCFQSIPAGSKICPHCKARL